jgi:hypothetical protein
MAINKEYSFKDFTNKSLLAVPVEELTGDIVGSCFYQEGAPDTHIFPESMTGVTFKRCNLDNVYIPVGNTVTDADGVSSSQERVMVQNDQEDWKVNEVNAPIEPVNKKRFLRLKAEIEAKNLLLAVEDKITTIPSIDPADIPVEPLSEAITKTAEEELNLKGV